VVKVVGRFDELGPEVVGADDDLHGFVVEQFGRDAVEGPHFVARVFEAGGAVEVSAKSENGGEKSVERAEDRGPLIAGFILTWPYQSAPPASPAAWALTAAIVFCHIAQSSGSSNRVAPFKRNS
jgi:hypothetical protein